MPGALDGIRVVDMTQMIAGPYCTQMLADLGADVIKVEEPATAPGRRQGLSPPVRLPDGTVTTFAAYWLNANRNKRAITLNLRSDDGKAVLADLLRASDVVVENFTDHTCDVLGISQPWGRAIRSDLVWASLTGFGRTGPDRARESWDFLAQARGGFLSITGDPDGPPMKAGNSLVDFLGGLHMAVAIVAAIRHRDRSGEGQFIDISLLDSLIPCLDGFPMYSSIAGVAPQRSGNFHPMKLPGYSVFPCKDGFVVLGAPPGPIWQRLTEAIERPDLAGEVDIADRQAWGEFFARAVAAITAWTSARTRAQVRETLDAHRVANEPVRDLAEIWDDPQLQARGMFYEHEFAPFGKVRTVGSPLKLSATPVEVRHPPPQAGEHNWDVLTQVLGYDEARVSDLIVRGVTESYEQ